MDGSSSISRPCGCTKKQPWRLHFRPNRQMVLFGSSSMLRPVGCMSVHWEFLQARPYLHWMPLVPSHGNCFPGGPSEGGLSALGTGTSVAPSRGAGGGSGTTRGIAPGGIPGRPHIDGIIPGGGGGSPPQTPPNPGSTGGGGGGKPAGSIGGMPGMVPGMIPGIVAGIVPMPPCTLPQPPGPSELRAETKASVAGRLPSFPWTAGCDAPKPSILAGEGQPAFGGTTKPTGAGPGIIFPIIV